MCVCEYVKVKEVDGHFDLKSEYLWLAHARICLDGESVFADDPVHDLPLSVNEQHVGALKGTNYLSTRLIDYLLQQALKDSIPSDLLIGTANAFTFFNAMNQKKPN
jgi:hypothetical protein